MGVFQEMVEIVNRTSKRLEVVFDGQRVFLEPNYTAEGEPIKGVHNMVPKIVVPYALNQCVVMGSEDAMDPSAFQSLIGVRPDKKSTKKHSWHDVSFLEQDEAELTRVPLKEYLDDPNVQILVRGKKAPRQMDSALPGTTVPFDMK